MGEHTTGRRHNPATVIRITAVVVAMLLVSVAMLQRSQSAFSGTTTYGNTGALGGATVNLTSAFSQTFDVVNMVPGDTMTRCVDVTYDGTATAAQLDTLRVHGQDAAPGGLTPYLDIKGEMAAAGQTCAKATTFNGVWLGTMQNTFAQYANYASGANTFWTPAARGDSRAFRFTVTMPAGVDNAAQGKTAKPVITFEVRTKGGAAR